MQTRHHSCPPFPGSAIQLPAAYCKTNTEIDRWAVLSFTLCTQGQETVNEYAPRKRKDASLCKQGVAELTEMTALHIMQLLPPDLQTPPAPDASIRSGGVGITTSSHSWGQSCIVLLPREVRLCHSMESQRQTDQQLFQIWKLLPKIDCSLRTCQRKMPKVVQWKLSGIGKGSWGSRLDKHTHLCHGGMRGPKRSSAMIQGVQSAGD